jgi:hypothetical protein
MMKVTSLTRDVPEFLRVVRWCYEAGLGWVIAASCRDGEMAIHLDLPDSDIRTKRFKQLVDGQPSWTVIVEAESEGERVAAGPSPRSESPLQ